MPQFQTTVSADYNISFSDKNRDWKFQLKANMHIIISAVWAYGTNLSNQRLMVLDSTTSNTKLC